MINQPRRARAANSFAHTVSDRLSGLGRLRYRAMFGGRGFWCGSIFFAIAYRSRLYFRVNEQTRPAYIAAGSAPFRPNRVQTMATYFEVPAAVVAQTGELLAWARDAVRAAATKNTRSTRKTLRSRNRPG